MDLFRKIGIGVVSIIPAFVLGGLVWHWFGSWLSVLGVVVMVGIFSGSVMSGKFSSKEQHVSSQEH
ncbi:MAG: hypothetical protein KJ573_04335 [Proteobacteria bacterium]|nr:hypothetical protein [Desulfobacteraceae bacterium]MBU0735578.1 hypothetical protein [Pseudomonadota bacterium]MBU1902802.1 hypothetical protein [Pseudomonadota bacterium]